jgi:phasin family protein
MEPFLAYTEDNHMHTDILAPLTKQSKRFMAPVQKFNNLAMAQTEKVITFQTVSLQKYAELGMAQWKAAAAVDDLESLSAYISGQGARMTEVGKQIMADTKQAYQLSTEFVSEAQKVAQENMTSVTEQAREKTPRKAAA